LYFAFGAFDGFKYHYIRCKTIVLNKMVDEIRMRIDDRRTCPHELFPLSVTIRATNLAPKNERLKAIF
jgi:hypothetical protein